MRKVIRYVVIVCIFAVIYVVLAGEVSVLNLGVGLVISFVAVIFSDRYLIYERYESLFPIKLWGFFIYIFYLMANIMHSGVRAAVLTVSGGTKLLYESFESTLPNDFALNLLANSITLTPGTVTVNRKDNVLFIMQLGAKDMEFDLRGVQKFEDNIKKLVIRE